MNTQNYASLEASKGLVDAGIVLETDFCWSLINPEDPHPHHKSGDKPRLTEWDYIDPIKDHNPLTKFPAPSLAEVWRELEKHKASLYFSNDVTLAVIEASPSFYNINPTDALIDLLIWVREQRKEQGK